MQFYGMLIFFKPPHSPRHKKEDMNTRRHFLSLILIFSLTLMQNAAASTLPNIFNKRLSAKDRQRLENGDVVIRKMSSISKLSIASSNEGVQKGLAVAKKLKPAYVAEIIQLYPYTNNEDFPDTFERLVLDVPQYAGIPYWSERAEKWYDLYSSAKIISTLQGAQTQTVWADLEMEPFGIISTRIEAEQTASYFYYISTNTNKMRYFNRFTCVNKEKMKSIIVLFKEGDFWVLYGMGLVDAPNIFFLRDRVETSFINRIKTFCSFFFAKLKEDGTIHDR